jgi:SAM-dependent methyltransferase
MGEPASEWWRSWFGPGYLALYDDALRERTPIEVDQLEALLQLRPPLRILDLPCGQGRHAIELARRGYQVTGVDLSPYLIGVATARAEAAGVEVRWLEGDMRRPVSAETFDLVLNLFTSFGYFLDEADDRLVTQAAAAMLEPGGRFLLEVINGERIMGHFVEREWFTVGQATVMERRSLDRSAHRMTVERTISRPAGDEVDVHALRLYGARDIESMLRASGFDRVEIYGDWDGGPVSPESLRVLAVGMREKKKGGS